MAYENKLNLSFSKLLDVMDNLREKCPWDQKQTIHSLSHLTMEETCELIDAIRKENFDDIKEELGDVLLHIVFYSKIASEQGRFSMDDVITFLIEKLIRRHPHIYGDVVVKDELEVKQNWEKIKQSESAEKKLVLDGVPDAMPAMVRAFRMQEKVASVGFDWPSSNEVIEKINEEIEEIKHATTLEDKEMEWGDLFFTLINYARKENINPENALQKSNDKFKNRFNIINREVNGMNKDITDYSLDQLESLWQKSKLNEK